MENYIYTKEGSFLYFYLHQNIEAIKLDYPNTPPCEYAAILLEKATKLFPESFFLGISMKKGKALFTFEL